MRNVRVAGATAWLFAGFFCEKLVSRPGMAEPISPTRRGGSQSFAPPLLLAEHQMSSSHGSMSCVPTPAITLIASALLLTHREHAPRWQGDTGGPHSPRARTAGTEQPLEGRPAEPTVDPRFAEPGSCTAQRPRPRRGRRACGGRAAERRERVVARARAVARATHAGAGALARAVRHGRDALLPDQARPFRGRAAG